MEVKFYKKHEIDFNNIIFGVTFSGMPAMILFLMLNEPKEKQSPAMMIIVSIFALIGISFIVSEINQLFKSMSIDAFIKSISSKDKLTFKFKGLSVEKEYVKTKRGGYVEQNTIYLFESSETGVVAIEDSLNLPDEMITKINHEVYDNGREFKINGYLYKDTYYISYNELRLLIGEVV